MSTKVSAKVSVKVSTKVSSKANLPSQFPVGTRYVIEGYGGRVHLRYVEFPDGRQVQLPAELVERATLRGRVSPGRRLRQKANARKF
jgi:hypothetical protein